MGLNYCFDVPLSIISAIPNFLKIYRTVQKLLVGGQTDSHFGLIEVTFNIITKIQNFIQIHQSVQKVQPRHEIKHLLF
jgi:hypothetical protein